MALRNRCCTEEEAKHKHDFDWLLEATTKVTIYISVTQLYKLAKHAVGKQRGKEKPRRNPSLNFLPPCVIYMHATNCDDQAGETWIELHGYYLPPPPLPVTSLLSFCPPSSPLFRKVRNVWSIWFRTTRFQSTARAEALHTGTLSCLPPIQKNSFLDPLSSSLPPSLHSSLHAFLPSSSLPLFPWPNFCLPYALRLSIPLSSYLTLPLSHTLSILHRSAQRQDLSMLTFLIRLGGNPLLLNTAERTPLQLLAINCFPPHPFVAKEEENKGGW